MPFKGTWSNYSLCTCSLSLCCTTYMYSDPKSAPLSSMQILMVNHQKGNIVGKISPLTRWLAGWKLPKKEIIPTREHARRTQIWLALPHIVMSGLTSHRVSPHTTPHHASHILPHHKSCLTSRHTSHLTSHHTSCLTSHHMSHPTSCLMSHLASHQAGRSLQSCQVGDKPST